MPLLLRKGSKEHPDFTALNAYLDELYGAILYGDIRKLGDTQVLNLSLQCLDEAYVLEKEPIATMAMELLLSLLLHPMIEDGGFEKESIGQEKQYLADPVSYTHLDVYKRQPREVSSKRCTARAFSMRML